VVASERVVRSAQDIDAALIDSAVLEVTIHYEGDGHARIEVVDNDDTLSRWLREAVVQWVCRREQLSGARSPVQNARNSHRSCGGDNAGHDETSVRHRNVVAGAPGSLLR